MNPSTQPVNRSNHTDVKGIKASYLRHREHCPAIERPDGYKAWWKAARRRRAEIFMKELPSVTMNSRRCGWRGRPLISVTAVVHFHFGLTDALGAGAAAATDRVRAVYPTTPERAQWELDLVAELNRRHL